MCKVVSLSLTILLVYALILSLLGVVVYAPLAMLASLVVLGLSVFVSSLLFGKLFGVRVHTESSFITAVILFFIFTPTLEVSGLVSLGLVGFIAAISKFLLTYRGRHIVNPVAIAAVVIGITGLAYATWWVATPAMVPLTLLLGFLIIQKTRRAHMSGTFAAVSIIIVVAMLLGNGASLGESLVLLLSWPIFFFASMMLTEPLTMPPKKWQQIVEALIVAVLFAVPFHIGDFSSSPALALVVGNVIAFAFRRQSGISLQFKEKKQLTPSSEEFIFTPLRKMKYEPGQYAEISIFHKADDLRGSRRSFSMTSSPDQKTVHFGVKFYDPSSSFKKALRELPKGAVIQVTGVSGDFTLPKNSSVPLLFIAGGIGITPFISHLQYLQRTHQQRDITLLYAVNSADEVAYRDILIASGITVVVVTKDAKGLLLHEGWKHAAEPYVTTRVIEKYVSNVVNRFAFISGPPLMIDGAKRSLKQLGAKKIRTDYFIGY